MAMSVLSFGRMRDLISNLGWKENDNTYTLGAECLGKQICLFVVFDTAL